MEMEAQEELLHEAAEIIEDEVEAGGDEASSESPHTPAAPSKVLGLFKDETEALGAFTKLQQIAMAEERKNRQLQELLNDPAVAAVAKAKLQGRQAPAADDPQTKADQLEKAQIAYYLEQKRPDLAAELMEQRTLRKLMPLVDQRAAQAAAASFHEISRPALERKGFLEAEGVKDLHEDVEELMALSNISGPGKEQDLANIVRNIKSRAVESARKQLTRNRAGGYLEPGSGGGGASSVLDMSPKEFDKFNKNYWKKVR